MIHRIQKLLSPEQTAEAQEFVRQAEFVDGKATNQTTSVKNNQQIDQADAEKGTVGDMIVQALFAHKSLARIAFPRTIPQPTFSRYEPGMYYGPHLDEALMSTRPRPLRSDLSVTIFLSEPSDYDGGELELWLGSDRSLVKMHAGDAVIYPTGIIHQVREITRGARYAAVSWIQSYIPSAQNRHVLSHYYQLMERMGPKADENDKLLMESVRTNLFRMWVDN